LSQNPLQAGWIPDGASLGSGDKAEEHDISTN
jgi:hypothetical protein